ncbi:uncharacterized protein LOC107607019 isoform X2 [Arachis ipaensis]|uniref:uncharacterized protein LOC107607019 isoform X2 n=1 Tax=Arachis ipaensis TaxID=130454 RepID=UPI000A2B8EEB|nr:uncharacterized protein LOC107607019 isoform X2 [Arachis ipaensis]
MSSSQTRERERGPPQSTAPLEGLSHITLPSRSLPSLSSVAVASPLKKRGRKEHRSVAQREELPPLLLTIIAVCSDQREPWLSAPLSELLLYSTIVCMLRRRGEQAMDGGHKRKTSYGSHCDRNRNLPKWD